MSDELRAAAREADRGTEREPYQKIVSVEELARWLAMPEYALADFGGDIGIGLTMRDGGGCWGVISPGVLDRALRFGFVSIGGRLTDRGHRLLGDMAHVPQRDGDCPYTKAPCRYGCEMECFLEP